MNDTACMLLPCPSHHDPPHMPSLPGLHLQVQLPLHLLLDTEWQASFSSSRGLNKCLAPIDQMLLCSSWWPNHQKCHPLPFPTKKDPDWWQDNHQSIPIYSIHKLGDPWSLTFIHTCTSLTTSWSSSSANRSISALCTVLLKSIIPWLMLHALPIVVDTHTQVIVSICWFS